ncbi:MAG: right-handed parallel beta-helix repeat-containing protein, partial [Candidatus Bipolaricaulota bacterium]|nr:right-handed parallel beta-helix repeat-containing protein [Candidatus Bipolaricaulota bacterium]
SDAQQVAIQENTIEGAGFAGVSLSEESEAVIIDNLMRGNKTGIMISQGRAWLKGNRVEGNGNPSLASYTGGVLIGSLAQVELEGNEIAENLGWGIITTNTASVITCRDNRVRGNRVGDYGWYSSDPPIEPQPSPELKQKCEGK